MWYLDNQNCEGNHYNYSFPSAYLNCLETLPIITSDNSSVYICIISTDCFASPLLDMNPYFFNSDCAKQKLNFLNSLITTTLAVTNHPTTFSNFKQPLPSNTLIIHFYNNRPPTNTRIIKREVFG